MAVFMSGDVEGYDFTLDVVSNRVEEWCLLLFVSHDDSLLAEVLGRSRIEFEDYVPGILYISTIRFTEFILVSSQRFLYGDSCPVAFMGSDSTITNDFTRFSSGNYLREYYSEIGTENAYLLEFLHRTHAEGAPVRRMLEVGGGPTIYQLISACRRTEEIVFSEYLPGNREAVRAWRDGAADAFDWDEYFAFVVRLEGAGDDTGERIQARKSALRHKLGRITPYDAKSDDPLPEEQGPFDLIGVNFCLESITSNEEEYRFSLGHMTELLAPGGMLVMTALKNAEYYHVGDLKFPAFPVDEKSVDRYLTDFSYGDIRVGTVPAEHTQGYEGLMTITARKRPA